MTLRTFFHISEYEVEGYEALPRVLAVCDEVVLWAPPTRALTNLGTRGLSKRAFLEFVESGRIRVAARHEWLTDEGYRSRLAETIWSDAAWDPDIDTELKRLLDQDKTDPSGRGPSVMAAPTAVGVEAALELLDTNMSIVVSLAERLRNEPWHLPPGVAAAARRAPFPGVPEELQLALCVVKDARNHADALKFSGAHVPVLMGHRDQDLFNSWVIWWLTQPGGPAFIRSFEPDASAGLPVTQQTQLFSDLLALLGGLETLNSGQDTPLLSGRAHDELTSWYEDAVIELLEYQPNGSVAGGGVIRRRLLRQLESHDYPSVREAVATLHRDPVGLLGQLLTVVGAVADPTQASSLAGITLSAVALGQETGVLPRSPVQGPSWPYLYAFNGNATRARQQALLRLLEGM